MLSLASYVLIYFSIYFAKKRHMSYKFFWVLDYLIIHLNLCDSFARYKFLVWKWFFPPWTFKAIFHCHPTSGLSIEKSDTNSIPNSLYVAFHALWKLWDILSLFQVQKFHDDMIQCRSFFACIVLRTWWNIWIGDTYTLVWEIFLSHIDWWWKDSLKFDIIFFTLHRRMDVN